MFPPRPGQCAYVIDGAHTEFLVTEYTDRLFIVVTQIGKLGTVFHLSRSQTAELSRALATFFASGEGRAFVREVRAVDARMGEAGEGGGAR